VKLTTELEEKSKQLHVSSVKCDELQLESRQHQSDVDNLKQALSEKQNEL